MRGLVLPSAARPRRIARPLGPPCPSIETSRGSSGGGSGTAASIARSARRSSTIATCVLRCRPWCGRPWRRVCAANANAAMRARAARAERTPMASNPRSGSSWCWVIASPLTSAAGRAHRTPQFGQLPGRRRGGRRLATIFGTAGLPSIHGSLWVTTQREVRTLRARHRCGSPLRGPVHRCESTHGVTVMPSNSTGRNPRQRLGRNRLRRRGDLDLEFLCAPQGKTSRNSTGIRVSWTLIGVPPLSVGHVPTATSRPRRARTPSPRGGTTGDVLCYREDVPRRPSGGA